MKKKKFFHYIIIFLSLTLPSHTSSYYAQNLPGKHKNLVANPQKKKKKHYSKKGPIMTSLLVLAGYTVGRKIYLSPTKTIQKVHLYRIEKKGSYTSYLYGVSHIQHAQFTLSQEVNKAADKTKMLATELDFDQDEDLLIYRNTLFKELLKKSHSENLGILEPFFNQIKTYQESGELHFIYNGYIFLAVKEKGKTQYTERLVYQLFKDKNRIGLETLKEELNAVGIDYKDPKELGKIEAEAVWKQLQKYKDDEKYRKEMDRASSLYKKGIRPSNEEKLSPKLTNTLAISKRNQVWLSKMISMMKSQPLFFTVGVLHLPWEQGLLALLLEQGYDITRIEPDGSEKIITLDQNSYNQPFL